MISLETRNGKVEEPHSTQPIVQGPQERHQEAPQAPPHFHQRGKLWTLIYFLFPALLQNNVWLAGWIFILESEMNRWIRSSWGTRGTPGSTTRRAVNPPPRKSRPTMIRSRLGLCFCVRSVVIWVYALFHIIVGYFPTYVSVFELVVLFVENPFIAKILILSWCQKSVVFLFLIFCFHYVCMFLPIDWAKIYCFSFLSKTLSWLYLDCGFQGCVRLTKVLGERKGWENLPTISHLWGEKTIT